LQGHGSIRLWLGTLLMLCASSALEGLFRMRGDTASGSDIVGQLIAVFVSDLAGVVFGAFLLIVTAVVSLPWLFGRNVLPFIGKMLHGGRKTAGLNRQAKTREGLAPREPRLAPGRFPAEDTLQARPLRESRSASSRPAPVRGDEAWKLPATYFGKDSVGKVTEQQPSGTSKSATARPSEEWAPFESLRATPAMLARARALEAASERMPRTETLRFAAPPGKAVPSLARPPERKPEPRMPSVAMRRPMVSSVAGRLAQEQVGQEQGAHKQVLHQESQSMTAEPEETVSMSPMLASIGEGAPASPVPDAVQAIRTQQGGHGRALPNAPSMLDDVALDACFMAEFVQAAKVSPHIEPVEPVEPPPAMVGNDQPEALEVPLGQPSWNVEPEVSLPSLPAADDMAVADAFPMVRPLTPPVAQRTPMGESFTFHSPADSGVDLPGLELLDMPDETAVEVSEAALMETGRLIEQRLKEFKVPVTVLGACAGPVITRFEIEPAVGVRGAQIVGLMKDLSRALGLTSIRVVETIPGKTCMGLELPNAHRQMIRLSEMLKSDAYRASKSRLTLAMGKDITGVPVVTDLARAPHMLVAGTTGSGKSVAVNAMILSLLYKATPEDVRMIMIDPKMLELSVYDGIPHLLAPVVTDMKLAANALTWCVAEMEKRYRLMSAVGVRNLASFNQKIRDARAAERHVPNPFSLTPDAPEPLSTLPLIVVVIDELADLMMVAGKKIEELIARLAQKARAAGIHLVLATQRPSVDVITGLIKANIPTRVAFQVSSKIDSRTVLDQMGAETLLGHGDMLFLPPGSGYPQRVHGAFVSDEEVHRVVEYLKQFGEPEYEEAILAGAPSEEASGDLFGDTAAPESDPLYDEAVAFVVRSRRASISAVQRQLRIGYNRAARLVEQMETAGIVSPMASNGSRDILVPPSSG
jgi:DNA segregation ATPase FtsK/SpoIIIE, S-DNA-T family